MSSPVPRTCTELVFDEGRSMILSRSQPHDAYDHLPAYVLLGDAGMGKSTEFKRMAEAHGDAAEYITARDFITFDANHPQEWQDKILFIDGLDEMRAGQTDSRIPLDSIRGALRELGRPRFRLSCREADWGGAIDRNNLNTVSPDSKITVLRLDSLDDDAILALLRSLDLVSDAEEFVEKAGRCGLGAMLRNPQTLKMLAEAVWQGETWPNSRQEIFDKACHKMAAERNDEHREGAERFRPAEIMDAAGYLCAVQLLAGKEGYSLIEVADDSPFIDLDQLDDPPDQQLRDCLRRALASNLFTGVLEQKRSPVHRHVAEFLGSRYLATLIDDGLPAARVTALMTSSSDGRVVTSLRGLSAWLAVHSPEARRRLIDLDPVGVGLYGEIANFTTDEKRQLLKSLAAFAKQGPLFGHERPDDRGGWPRGSTAQAFRSLATADMVPAIKDLLTEPAEAPRGERVTEFILDVLSEAEESANAHLVALAPDIGDLLFDAAVPPRVRFSALDAYLNVAPSNEIKKQTLLELLDEIREGNCHDPYCELRGTLLSYLYPDHLGPSQLWQFLLPPKEKKLIGGRFWTFHQRELLGASSDREVAELLDILHDDRHNLIPALEESGLGDLPLQVLARGLEELGDDIEPSRRYNWLDSTGRSRRIQHGAEEAVQRIQVWLRARPEIQKDTYLTWLQHQSSEGELGFSAYSLCRPLHWSSPPSRFGHWCLDEATRLAGAEPSVAQKLLEQSYRSLQDPEMSEGLTLEAIEERVREHNALAGLLDGLRKPPAQEDEPSEFEREISDLRAKHELEKRQQQNEWAELLRTHEDELRENRVSPQILDVLAGVYFALFAEVNEDSLPRDRISEFIGGDSELVDIVMVALQNAVWRDDVPEAGQTISWASESKRSLLALPVLASLELLQLHEPERLDEVDDDLKRKVLAVYYNTPTNYGHRTAPPSHALWVQEDPDLVLDVLYRCASSAFRAGETFIPGLNELDSVEGCSDLVRSVRLRLLEAFPVRAPKQQFKELDRLLGETLRSPELAGLEDLADRKLTLRSMTIAQQVRWHAVGALVNPDQNLEPFEVFMGQSETRTQNLAEFFRDSTGDSFFDPSLLGSLPDPAVLSVVIKVLGRKYDPLWEDGLVTLEIGTSERISKWIELLGSVETSQAAQALSGLIDDPKLAKWRDHLRRAWERQNVALRDATYSRLGILQIQRTLDNGLPANAGDLAGLLDDRLSDAAAYIRGDSSNPWRGFWNEKPGPELMPKYEEHCRDHLIQVLRACGLPRNIDAAPEGRYASDTRADIRFTHGGFNVPIEIKKDSHRDLWSSLNDQLIAQYTTDPTTSGHGIYLVLWFGLGKATRSPQGHRPATPYELQRELEAQLTPEQARKISVRVLDVTKP